MTPQALLLQNLKFFICVTQFLIHHIEVVLKFKNPLVQRVGNAIILTVFRLDIRF
jgi:hypothetical protein